jgi:hypothetical protein
MATCQALLVCFYIYLFILYMYYHLYTATCKANTTTIVHGSTQRMVAEGARDATPILTIY